MERKQLEENLIDYLYGEMNGAEELDFRGSLEQHSDLQDEISSYKKVRQIYRRSLPLEPVPPYLLNQIRQKVKLQKSSRWAFLSLWRPAFVGAGVAALLVLFVNFFQGGDLNHSLNLLKGPVATAPSYSDNSTEFREPVFRSSVPRPYWGEKRRYGMGIISNASLGGSYEEDQVFDSPFNQDIGQLDQRAQLAVAQLYYQQAVRLHKMGENAAAARQIAQLLQRYPNFPQFYQALALRINCLFHEKDYQQANAELSWLKNRSPDLAQLLEDHWKR